MAGFTIDLEGRIKNFPLPKNKPLLPLFEAVVNSIYAIEERQRKESFQGKIDIHIIRVPQEVLEGVDKSINEITGFVIVDNGIGFDENNMKSFLQSDSTYRADKGGKGIGRFTWLKAFERASIESIFKEDDSWVKRNFEFSLKKQEIDDTLIEVDEIGEYSTKISLIDYLPAYRKTLTKNAEVIANRLMQHCLIYLMGANCPIINIIDEERICINDMFEKNIEKEQIPVRINIEGENFKLLNTKVSDSSIGGSKLFLYANDRMVLPIDLDKEIVNLDKNLFEEQGYYYVGILSGKYLDDNVDSNRTSFEIAETGKEEGISLEDIVAESKVYVEEYLLDYLESVRSKKEARIRKYIATNAPQFGHLLKYMPDAIGEIKPTLSDTKLDEELYKIKRKFDVELKRTNQEIIDKINIKTEDLDVYKDKWQKQIEKISDANKAALSEYVSHRRIILDLLKKGVLINDDGKFNKEAYIHNLIYPMRRTSEDIGYEAHNLWMVDERLSYCEYISSDIPFNNDRTEQRTDILFLDKPVALSDQENLGKEYESIVIIELKRPMRDDYKPGENPIDQLMGYQEKLASNSVTDKNGRPVKVGKSTQFYLYAVCDITDSLMKYAKRYGFHETPDKLGLYWYNDNARAYMEIISFDKLINDAEKRNRVLFDKLGI